MLVIAGKPRVGRVQRQIPPRFHCVPRPAAHHCRFIAPLLPAGKLVRALAALECLSGCSEVCRIFRPRWVTARPSNRVGAECRAAAANRALSAYGKTPAKSPSHRASKINSFWILWTCVKRFVFAYRGAPNVPSLADP